MCRGLTLVQFFWAWLRLSPGDAIAIPLGRGNLRPAPSPVPAERVSFCKQPPKQISTGSELCQRRAVTQAPVPQQGQLNSPPPATRPAGKRPFAFTARAWIHPRAKPFPLPKPRSKSFPGADSSSAGGLRCCYFQARARTAQGRNRPAVPSCGSAPMQAAGGCWSRKRVLPQLQGLGAEIKRVMPVGARREEHRGFNEALPGLSSLSLLSSGAISPRIFFPIQVKPK